MKRFEALLVFSMAIIFLAACSSQQKQPELNGYLATQIEPDGSKLFVYSLEVNRPENSSGRRSHGGGSGGRSGGTGGRSPGGSHGGKASGGSKNLSGKMESMLEAELVKTGYCRDGYTELESEGQPPNLFIKGKCNEPATEGDREDFPNESAQQLGLRDSHSLQTSGGLA
jgi:hypothetical protein